MQCLGHFLKNHSQCGERLFWTYGPLGYFVHAVYDADLFLVEVRLGAGHQVRVRLDFIVLGPPAAQPMDAGTLRRLTVDLPGRGRGHAVSAGSGAAGAVAAAPRRLPGRRDAFTAFFLCVSGNSPSSTTTSRYSVSTTPARKINSKATKSTRIHRLRGRRTQHNKIQANANLMPSSQAYFHQKEVGVINRMHEIAQRAICPDIIVAALGMVLEEMAQALHPGEVQLIRRRRLRKSSRAKHREGPE